MAEEIGRKGTGIRQYPPVIFAVAVVAALALHWLIPVSVLPEFVQMPMGISVIAVGVLIGVISAYGFWRYKTTIHPHGAATSLMTGGIFAVSRNPIYLAMLLISLGIGVWVDTLWMLPALIGAVWFLHVKVIVLEEKFLADNFGAKYEAYCARVRRWL